MTKATPAPSSFTRAALPLLHWLLGAGARRRQHVLGVAFIALVYGLCTLVAAYAVEIGIMREWGLILLLAFVLPMSLLILVLVRVGWTYHPDDPLLILPQNVLALVGISGAYLTIGPADRGAVFGLLVLVVMFAMYTHTPRHALAVGVTAIGSLGLLMLVMSQVDPTYYPLWRELMRLELLLSVLPVLALTAWQLAHWRNRLRRQKVDLREALDRVQHLATRDSLTGLYNRRHMQERLEDAWNRQERYSETFTVALLDLDHFKQVNDVHGHAVGDEVLGAFGRLASGVLRDSDVLSRWGGEEFLILFPDCLPAQAERALMRLRAQIARVRLSASQPDLRVTFSAGVSVHLPLTPLSDTLERADRALYAAKADGRDRVQFDPDSLASVALVRAPAGVFERPSARDDLAPQ